jgi:hypothetical protein
MARRSDARQGEGTKRSQEMEKKTIGELNEQSLRLAEFLRGLEPGANLSYLQIENETGVKMDMQGKGYLRRCLKRLKLEYSCRSGYGVQLANAETVMPILSTRICQIDHAVKRGNRTQKLLQEQFYDLLTAEDQRAVLLAGAVFGLFRLAADQGRPLYNKRMAMPTAISIEIPKFA